MNQKGVPVFRQTQECVSLVGCTVKGKMVDVPWMRMSRLATWGTLGNWERHCQRCAARMTNDATQRHAQRVLIWCAPHRLHCKLRIAMKNWKNLLFSRFKNTLSVSQKKVSLQIFWYHVDWGLYDYVLWIQCMSLSVSLVLPSAQLTRSHPIPPFFTWVWVKTQITWWTSQ